MKVMGVFGCFDFTENGPLKIKITKTGLLLIIFVWLHHSKIRKEISRLFSFGGSVSAKSRDKFLVVPS